MHACLCVLWLLQAFRRTSEYFISLNRTNIRYPLLTSAEALNSTVHRGGGEV